MDSRPNDNVKRRIIAAGRRAVDELIKIAEEPILYGRLGEDNTTDDGLAADKITRAAQSKKIAIFDAFEILEKILKEEEIVNAADGISEPPPQSFVESRNNKK